MKTDPTGTTLLEAIIAISIMALLLVVVANLTIATVRYQQIESVRSEIVRQAVIGLEPIRDAGEHARAIRATSTINGIFFTSSSSTIILDLPSVNASGNPIPSSTDIVAFTRKAGMPRLLVRNTNAAPGSKRVSRTDTLAHDVSNLTFLYPTSTPSAATSFTVLLATSSTYRGLPYGETLTSIVTIRNP